MGTRCDVSLTDSLNFYRDPNFKNSTFGDIGGAAWYKINRNNLNRVKISFIPVIKLDLNFYGNVIYPQGFVLVFTASPIIKLLGEKRSGFGFDGINDAVPFEWDFLQNSDKNDIRAPQFSAHYNLNKRCHQQLPPHVLKFVMLN
jgi:hypothetical protein